MIIDRIKCAGLTAWCAVKDIINFFMPWVIIFTSAGAAYWGLYLIWSANNG